MKCAQCEKELSGGLDTFGWPENLCWDCFSQGKERPSEPSPRHTGQAQAPRTRGVSAHIDKFVRDALKGPAKCRISIAEIPELDSELIEALKSKATPPSDVVTLVNSLLLGVCPDCATWTGGQGLSLIGTLGEAKASIVIMTGATGGGERLINGRCRNYSCSCTDILVFWRPDDDPDAVRQLAQMGIKIKQRYKKQW